VIQAIEHVPDTVQESVQDEGFTVLHDATGMRNRKPGVGGCDQEPVYSEQGRHEGCGIRDQKARRRKREGWGLLYLSAGTGRWGVRRLGYKGGWGKGLTLSSP
jgi:hypothetical protein